MLRLDYLSKLLIHLKVMLQTIHQSLPAFVRSELGHYCFRFCRCFYSMSKEYFGELEDEENERRRLQRSRFRRYRDIAILLYFTRIFFPAFIVYHVTNPGVIRVAASIDPVVSIVYHNTRFFQPFMAVVMYLIVFTDFLIQQSFGHFERLKRNCNHSSSSNIPWWRWWYELVVFSQDAYSRAMIRGARLKVVHDRRQAFLEAKFPTIAGKLLPKFLLKVITRLFVLWQLENVDKAALFDRRQHIRPAQSFAHLSVTVRSHLLRFLFLTDLGCFFGLIFASNEFP